MAKAKAATIEVEVSPTPVKLGPSVEDRMAAGKALRERVPRTSHAAYEPAPDRADPVDLLESQSKDRVQELVPVRYGRMATSPFAFYRGSAIVMADDLAHTPASGIDVQACGDAHLSNFGIFATPERNIVFDLNDFDETLPGPWEWDVKRLAASFVIAGRHREFDPSTIRLATTGVVRSYGLRLREFAAMRNLDVWYSRIDVTTLLQAVQGQARARVDKAVEKARLRDHLQAQAKLTEVVDGVRRIKNNPPLLVRADTFDHDFIVKTFEDYARTLQKDRQSLLARYRFVDVAMKVVGVGSVGTRCFAILLQGRDDGDPFFLQVKEANKSVLERHQRKSHFPNHAQRVVEGQRLTQAASDIFLGWIRGRGEEHRDFYWRQLLDVKGSADLETIAAPGLILYGELCGAALARAHARSGDAAMITGYIGTGAAFANAVADFAEAYADQAVRDHAALVEAIRTKRVPVEEGV